MKRKYIHINVDFINRSGEKLHKYEGESYTNTKAKAIQIQRRKPYDTKAKAIRRRKPYKYKGVSHTKVKAMQN